MPKLIRDKIPELMQAEGGRPRLRPLTGDDLALALRDKLQEECAEFSAAATPAHRLEELADILEVMSALAALDGYDLAAVTAAADAKRTRKGGFGAGVLYLGEEEAG